MTRSHTPESYWNEVFSQKPLETVSWYEPVPARSLHYIAARQLPLSARILDVGGGDSLLVDHLLDLGYTNLTVLDISAQVLQRAQARLGDRADQVAWVVSDVTDFEPDEPFDFWHDRAAFHFLTSELQIARYLSIAARAVRTGGTLSVGTFSDQGPTRCSGLPIRQYSALALAAQFVPLFDTIQCESVTHQTPGGAKQAFTFCQFIMLPYVKLKLLAT